MIVQRLFYRPMVRISVNPEKVCIQTPISYDEDNRSEYFETALTPSEAEALALDLMIDARRARGLIATNEFLARKVER